MIIVLLKPYLNNANFSPITEQHLGELFGVLTSPNAD